MFSKTLFAMFLMVPFGQAQKVGWDLGQLKALGLKGERSAQLRLGLAYYSGIGAQKNLNEAFYWYEKAAKQGDPVAAHYLARAYSKGLGTHRDSNQVIYWYREAALGTNAFARKKLVTLLRDKDSGSLERAEAYAWCLIGSEIDDKELQKKLKILEEQEEAVTLSAGKAKAIELKQAIDERTKALLPKPRDPNRGTFLYPTGERYFGQIQDGRPHGHGIVDAPNGDRFYGEFRNGRAHGYGMLFAHNGRVLFSGLWDNDKAVTDDGTILPLTLSGTKPAASTIKGSNQK